MKYYRFWGLFALLTLVMGATECDAQWVRNLRGSQPPMVPNMAPSVPGSGSQATATSAPAVANLPRPVPTAPNSAGTIKIASFNIQVFGTSKLQKPEVVDVLVKVVRRFDVVAIQEVRSTDDTVLPRFVAQINADGSRYDFVIGPRLGRTSSKEQYAFVFNTARIETDRRTAYTAPDPQDLLHREPFVCRFRVRGVPPNQAFIFNLVNIHTDPDETRTELDALADVFVGTRRNGSGEDDVIVLGDLNVDENHLGKLGQLPNMVHAISGVTTNTRRNKMYDNILFDRTVTVEYTGRSGMLDLMSEFKLTEAQALEVSDHCPVWAEFGVYEGSNNGFVAARPSSPTPSPPAPTPRY